jgi:hypothetical protein
MRPCTAAVTLVKVLLTLALYLGVKGARLTLSTSTRNSRQSTQSTAHGLRFDWDSLVRGPCSQCAQAHVYFLGLQTSAYKGHTVCVRVCPLRYIAQFYDSSIQQDLRDWWAVYCGCYLGLHFIHWCLTAVSIAVGKSVHLCVHLICGCCLELSIFRNTLPWWGLQCV